MRFFRQALLGAAVVGAFSMCLTGCGRSVAKVNGQKISRKEYQNRLEKLTINVNGQQREVGAIALEGLIQEKLRMQLAGKEGVEPTKDQVKARMDMMKADGTTRKLKTQGWTDEDIRKNAETRQVDFNIITKGVKITEDDCESFYRTYKGRLFTAPAGREMSIIVTNSQKKTKLVRELLKVRHQEFRGVAMKHSDIPELRESGGALGFVPADIKILPADRRPPLNVHKIMFSLKPGEISEPIKVREVWYTLKMINSRDEKVRSYQSTRNQIKEMVMLQKAQEMYTSKGKKHVVSPADKMQNFTKGAKVKINIGRYVPLWDSMRKAAMAKPSAQPASAPR
ncbi:MAG: peptidyl-prolyl cis-trans isomerase [Armatimonadota bacterium]|nr:peptidyl-prolyl cis-trans isomerase [Armatimonadota bacterium]